MPHGVPNASNKRRRRFRLGAVVLLGVAAASWLALRAGDPLADARQGGTFVSTEAGGDPTKPHLG